MAETGDRITRIYSNFRGADFRGEEINLIRSPDCLNVWKDYKKTESIRTRPGLELLNTFEDAVYGIFFYSVGGKEIMIVHSGTKLYKCVGEQKEAIYHSANAARSEGFVYNNTWYFKDGLNYLQYDGIAVKSVEGYAPITTHGMKPAGGGTRHEDVNLLTGRRKNSFLSDGNSRDYHLDSREIDKDFTPIVTVNDKNVTDFTVNYDTGTITFTGDSRYAIPLTDGRDNVIIEFSKKIDGYADRIRKCTLLSVFDNRVFFSGNKDFPNTVWHCSLHDPTYCSDTDYYNEGLDTAAVRGLVAGNNALWVFREPSQANTTVFYHVPTLDGEYGKIYPSSHSSIATGCIGKAINFGDDIVFFSDRGMEGISGDITSEQVIRHRSTLIDSKLLTEKGYKDMILEEWEGYLIVFIGDKAYLADSRATFTNENHIEYEWFYWDFDKEITSARVNGGLLYIGTKDGVYTLTDNNCDIESYWVTPKDKFNAPQKLKTTNKRGCTVEAEGDIELFAKVEDTGFEPIGSFEDIKDYFVARIKRKKFKDIQLKFYSKKRFCLETATLECFIGGYIKR